MAAYLFLTVVCLLHVTVQSCPLQCTCRDILLDHRTGRGVDCSWLYLDEVPSITAGALRLDFSHNSLLRVPTEAIRPLEQLRELDLSDNRIQHAIPNNAFQNNIQLLVLDLSGNHIPELSPNSFAGLRRLEKLDLHNNLIAFISSEVLQPISVTTVMCLGDNHWHCGCQLFDNIAQRPRSNRAGDITCEDEEPECTTPTGLYGQPISSLNRESICVTTTTTIMETTSKSETTKINSVVKELSSNDPVEASHQETKENIKDHPSLDNNTLKDLPVVGYEAEGGILTKEFVLYIAVILGIMLLAVFLLLAVVLSKMSSKRRRLADQVSESWVYPWPLLQSQRRLPAELPDDNASAHTVYDEIPCTMNDYSPEPGSQACQLTQLRADQSLPVDKGKLKCLETIQAQAKGFDEFRYHGDRSAGVYASAVASGDADSAAYVPMHSPKDIAFKDLYGLSETFN